MAARILATLLLATVIGMTLSAAEADYPAVMEQRLEQAMGRNLAGLDPSLSYRVCLLNEDEVLVDVTLGTRVAGVARDREARVLFEARQRVDSLIAERFPGVKLSNLSTFHLRGVRPGELYALR